MVFLPIKILYQKIAVVNPDVQTLFAGVVSANAGSGRYNSFVVFNAILLLSLLLSAETQEMSAISEEKVPLIYLLAPGGTHFYEGDTAEGLAFAITELGLIGAGISVSGRLDGEDREELNVPYLLATQVYIIDKWSFYQKRMKENERRYGYNGVGYDPSPLSDLLLAPFKKENVFTPLVLTFVALGSMDGFFGYPKDKKRFRDISGVRAAGHNMSRDTGTLYYETASAAVSWGAATSEEMLFRGMLMPILDYRYGKKTGLAASSITFGLLHLANPDVSYPFYLFAQATLAGFIFGNQVQKDDYRMGKVIAAHFWYDFVSMTTTWITNPGENPLGVGVAFRF